MFSILFDARDLYISIMKHDLRRILRRIGDAMAPLPPILDPLDHPDLANMGPRDLDDLPLPRPGGRAMCPCSDRTQHKGSRFEPLPIEKS